MIHNETNLEVADNSGARRVQCIKVLGGSKRKFASVGDIIIVSIKQAIPFVSFSAWSFTSSQLYGP